MLLSDFNFVLPPDSIAQRPLPERDGSRMLLLNRTTGAWSDSGFAELPRLLRGDELLVVNDARVIPARLFCRRAGVHAEKKPDGSPGPPPTARIEVMLTARLEQDLWEALVRPGRKVRTGERLQFEGSTLEADVVERGTFGLRQLRFSGAADTLAAIEAIGHIPLPPYIRREDDAEDRERYQTLFAQKPGAVAAPTAGLHFTPAILEQVRARGVEIRSITLHVGLGTFQPVHAENIEDHQIHAEEYEISEETAAAIAAARRPGRPVLAVGTTVVRALEDSAQKALALQKPRGTVLPGRQRANIFLRPGSEFAVVDQLLTNFHLPESTLLMLVAAFAGKDRVLAAYEHAVAAGYRFYSYGDCMLIRP